MWGRIGTSMVALLLIRSPTSAGFAETALDVSLTINGTCTVSTGRHAIFGTYAAITTDLKYQAGILFECTEGLPIDITLDGGKNEVNGQRYMAGETTPTDMIAYDVYSDDECTELWPPSTAVSATGHTSTFVQHVFVKIPATTVPSSQSYSDTITVSVSY